MSRGCGHPSCRQEKESCWRHACGCRLRTVLHRTATSLGLPPPMSSSCICIAAPLSLLWQMKTTNRTPIVGALTRPGGRSAGSSCRNGCGTSALSVGTSVGANSHAYHRVYSCHSAAERAGRRLIRSRLRVWSTHHCHPPRKAGRFSGSDFPLQPDGTLRCPAGQPLHPHEQRREADGSLRVV